MDQGMERRSFLKTAAIAGAAVAGAGLFGCAGEDAASGGSTYEWDKEADVVIVGGGGTGLAAAAQASADGASVLVLEKSPATGGSTAMSGGVTQAAGTSWQKEFTEYQDDTPEKHAMTWITEGEGQVDEDMVRDLAYAMPDHMEWLASLGLNFIRVYGHNHIPALDKTDYYAQRIHTYEGGGAAGGGTPQTDALRARAEANGATVEVNTEVTGLIYEADKGVIGVKANGADGEILVKAAKGVVIATAGPDRAEDICRQICPQQYWDIQENVLQASPYNTGDGLRMAYAIGAAPSIGGCIDYDGLCYQGVDNTMPQIPCVYVNAMGKRFVCEDGTYGYMNRAIFQQNKTWEGPCWMICDADGIITSPTFPSQDLVDGKVEDGSLLKADTVTALAGAIGVPSGNLEATLSRWNEMITAEGADVEYGRNTQAVPISKAPFYAMKLIPHNLGACGGIKTNVECEVINVNGEVIPHLFAGGLCQGGWIGPYYPGSGTALAGTVHWGRKCGANAAATEAWV